MPVLSSFFCCQFLRPRFTQFYSGHWCCRARDHCVLSFSLSLEPVIIQTEVNCLTYLSDLLLVPQLYPAMFVSLALPSKSVWSLRIISKLLSWSSWLYMVNQMLDVKERPFVEMFMTSLVVLRSLLILKVSPLFPSRCSSCSSLDSRTLPPLDSCCRLVSYGFHLAIPELQYDRRFHYSVSLSFSVPWAAPAVCVRLLMSTSPLAYHPSSGWQLRLFLVRGSLFAKA